MLVLQFNNRLTSKQITAIASVAQHARNRWNRAKHLCAESVRNMGASLSGIDAFHISVRPTIMPQKAEPNDHNQSASSSEARGWFTCLYDIALNLDRSHNLVTAATSLTLCRSKFQNYYFSRTFILASCPELISFSDIMQSNQCSAILI